MISGKCGVYPLSVMRRHEIPFRMFSQAIAYDPTYPEWLQSRLTELAKPTLGTFVEYTPTVRRGVLRRSAQRVSDWLYDRVA